MIRRTFFKALSSVAAMLTLPSLPTRNAAAGTAWPTKAEVEKMYRSVVAQERALHIRRIPRITASVDGRPIESAYVLHLHADDEATARMFPGFIGISEYWPRPRAYFSENEIGAIQGRGWRVVINNAQIVGAPELCGGPMERVQYGEYLSYGPVFDKDMPDYARRELSARADQVAAKIGYPIVAREYLWIHAGVADKSDPLCQRAVGAIKYWIEEPRSRHDARVRAEIAAGGWADLDHEKPDTGTPMDLADFRLDGRLARYWRRA